MLTDVTCVQVDPSVVVHICRIVGFRIDRSTPHQIRKHRITLERISSSISAILNGEAWLHTVPHHNTPHHDASRYLTASRNVHICRDFVHKELSSYFSSCHQTPGCLEAKPHRIWRNRGHPCFEAHRVVLSDILRRSTRNTTPLVVVTTPNNTQLFAAVIETFSLFVSPLLLHKRTEQQVPSNPNSTCAKDRQIPVQSQRVRATPGTSFSSSFACTFSSRRTAFFVPAAAFMPILPATNTSDSSVGHDRMPQNPPKW